ncbi:MAG: hypothetical protein EA424_10625 [Planctomycetaceae bacterium]|nr:MAG: hypothetical protein EA424_10625 [Planctomycetaceae bacterium]
MKQPIVLWLDGDYRRKQHSKSPGVRRVRSFGFPIGRTPPLLLAGMLLAMMLLAGMGCTMVPQGWLPLDGEISDDKSAEASRLTGVGVESEGLVLGESEGAGLSATQLLSFVAAQLAEQRSATARREIHGYPEVAWQLLRGPVPATNATALRAIAAAHDAQCIHPSAAGWQALLEDRQQRPLPYQRYAQRRVAFLETLRQGFPGQALETHPLPPATDGLPAVMAIDAWQLTGTALLLDGRPAQAADALEQGVRVAANKYPYYQAHLRLQWSEALRGAGRIDQADTAWRDAVSVAQTGLRADPPLLDPNYWQQVAYHRPVDQPWPESLVQTLAQRAARYGVMADTERSSSGAASGDVSVERYLWACMGQWWLERGEPQAALVAWRRAAGFTVDPLDQQRLELAQAKALMALEQPAAATTLLVAISDSTDRPIQADALATLGSLRLASGSTKQGYHLLSRALTETDSTDWPGRARAEADFGLAHLLVGDQSAGLDWLRRAQSRFESDGAHDDLIQSLENELAYAQQTNSKDRVRTLEQRIEHLQR